MTRSVCPICGKPAAAAFRPFCSARCANVDLSRWFSGTYSIADGEGTDGAPAEDRETGD